MSSISLLFKVDSCCVLCRSISGLAVLLDYDVTACCVGNGRRSTLFFPSFLFFGTDLAVDSEDT